MNRRTLSLPDNDPVTPHFLDQGLPGPLNVQGRLTDEGPKFFERTPR